MRRPHEDPHCPCRGCVHFDCPECLADCERLLGIGYEPWMAEVVRGAEADAQAMLKKFGPLAQAMGRAAARHLDDILIGVLKGEPHNATES